MADDQTQIVKQPANSATYTRAAAVAGGVVGTTALVAYGLIYFFQILTYYSPGFPVPAFVSDPGQMSVVAGAIAGLFAGGISFSVRGTTVSLKDKL